MKTRRRVFPAVMAALLALLLIAPVSAQGGTPVPMDGQPAGVLAEVQVEALPSPHAEVWFLRFELEAGGSLPLGLQVGPTVGVVEAGEVTIVTDQPVEIDGSAPMATPAAEGELTTVATAGQVVYVHEDTDLTIRNDGDAPVSLLALLLFSPERETESMESDQPAEPVGMSQTPIGLTVGEFPEGPGTIAIERVVLEPNATVRADLPGGAIAGGVEEGSVAVTAESGNGFLWPEMMVPLGPAGGDQAPERIDIEGSGEGELEAGDGFGFWNAGVAWEAGDDGATILQVRITPAGTGMQGTPEEPEASPS